MCMFTSLSMGCIPSSFSHSFPPSSSLEYRRRTVSHTQNWSWSDRGQSLQPPPVPTRQPPARTLCTLRSSSRKNSCKHSSSGHVDVTVPPGEGKDSSSPNWTEWHSKDYIYKLPVWHLAFVFWAASMLQQLVNEGFVFPQCSSIPVQQFLGLNSVVLFVGIAGLWARCL